MKNIEKKCIIKEAEKAFRKLQIETKTNLSFCHLTTYGCGGKIALTVFPKSLSQIVYCLNYLLESKTKHLVLGKGSNCLAGDGFFDGVVVCTKKLCGIKIFDHHAIVLAGTNTVVLANALQQSGLCGGEFLYCLPATVGGAVFGNAGCYQQSMADIVNKVYALRGNKLVVYNNSECGFSKRNSVFKTNGEIIVAVQLKLELGDGTEIKNKMQTNLMKKLSTQPLQEKSMGCVFYNQSGTASKLIDLSKLKGQSVGGAEVSKIHAGFIVNIDKASANDTLQLMEKVQKSVYSAFGEELSREVQLIGNFL